MKKALSVLLTLAVLLSLAYQTVFAAEGTLELLETRNDARGNVIFVFRFTGDFKKNDFKGGKVFFGDESFPMGCNIVDKEEGIVQCTTSRATAGQYVNINLAGFVICIGQHSMCYVQITRQAGLSTIQILLVVRTITTSMDKHHAMT